MDIVNKLKEKFMPDENTTTTDGQVNPTAPTILDDDLPQHEIDEIMADEPEETGDTLNGASAPEESAHDHEASPAQESTQSSNSPLQNAHEELQNQQGKLHEKIVELAKRLEGVLATPFDGSQKPLDNAQKTTAGKSPVVAKLAESTAQSQNTEHVVDHLLNNLEV